ncbi:hypothetical protein Pyn_35361 [Prunus yedoensis var. nudiflora]|uniref:Secreted protein n=1 Tax=Prunus yedoensis var. nudiflora TaxID=2094558 RepID=A0A314XT10_PRUYE|nr:hypothetical protein Pyn_35361 [Prunus yedoensis var. nudiflora]
MGRVPASRVALPWLITLGGAKAAEGGSADVAGSDWVERLGMERLAVVGEKPVPVPVCLFLKFFIFVCPQQWNVTGPSF